jgi:hypothetical protein
MKFNNEHLHQNSSVNDGLCLHYVSPFIKNVKRNFGYKEKLFIYFDLQKIDICLLCKPEKLISKSYLAQAYCTNCNLNFDICYFSQ